MRRIVDMEDDLQERIEALEEDIKDNFIEYLEENPDILDFDEYYQNIGCDTVHEVADMNTPIYYKNINDLYYLYGDKFDEAYENAGIGDKKEDNYMQVAIYCYLYEKGFEYLNKLEKLFEEYSDNIKELIKKLKGEK